jgi:hypothetical protein
MKQLIEHKNKGNINQNTSKEIVMPIQDVCVLDKAKKRVFKHNKVIAKNKDH